jgi:hypothetical protein
MLATQWCTKEQYERSVLSVKQEEWWQREACRCESWCTRTATSHCHSVMVIACHGKEMRRREAQAPSYEAQRKEVDVL